MTLLTNALITTTNRLNDFLRSHAPLDAPWVICSNLSQPDGTPEEGTKDKIVATLLGLTPETTISSSATMHSPGAGSLHGPAPLHINAHLLFTANFAGPRYIKGLELLSLTIAFFQANPVFTQQNTPELSPYIDKLAYEMTPLSFADLGDVMAAQKARHMPSVVYQMRGLVFRDGALITEAPATD